MTAPADKGKKAKTDTDVGEENEQIDGALVLSIERLQEIQDELEKVSCPSLSSRSILLRRQCWGGCTAGFLSGLIGAGDCVKFRST